MSEVFSRAVESFIGFVRQLPTEFWDLLGFFGGGPVATLCKLPLLWSPSIAHKLLAGSIDGLLGAWFLIRPPVTRPPQAHKFLRGMGLFMLASGIVESIYAPSVIAKASASAARMHKAVPRYYARGE